MLSYNGFEMKRQRVPKISMLTVRAAAYEEFERTTRAAIRRIVVAFGNSEAARLLGVDRAQVTRWSRGSDSFSAEMRPRITDLDYILNRALQVFAPDVVGQWLVGSEPFLGGARPIDVLSLKGPAPLIHALDAIVQGAFA